MNKKLKDRELKGSFAPQHNVGAIPKEKMLAHRDGPRPLLDEAGGYSVVQFHQPGAYSGTDNKSSGSYAFFCNCVGQFKTSLFVSVQAEVEDMTWVVKEMADQRPNNAPACSTPSPLPVLPSAASCGAGRKEPLRSAFCLVSRASRAFLFSRALSLSPWAKSNIMSDWFLGYHFGITATLASVAEVYIKMKSIFKINSPRVL